MDQGDTPDTNSSKSQLLNPAQFSRRKLAIIASAFVLLGLIVIFVTRAAFGPLATVQAELLSVPAGASVVENNTAMKFTTDATATSSAPFSLSGAASSVVVRAKGTQCAGSPRVVVKIGNSASAATTTLQTSTVSTSSFADYTASASVPAGSYYMSVSFAGDYTHTIGNSGKFKCSRDLTVDKVTLYGEDGTVSEPSLTEKIGRAASASSIEGVGYEADKAIDGISTTRWASTSGIDNQWWQVDLGGSTAVSKVDVNWEVAYASSYKIQGSNDGVTFTDLASVTLGQAGLKSTSFPETTARYIRIQGLTRGTVWGYSIWDAKVYGSGSTPVVPLTVRIDVPTSGATVSGGAPVKATLTATAPNTGSKVEFYLDGVLKTSDNTAPYCMAGDASSTSCNNWDSTTVSNSLHTLRVVGYDSAGGRAEASTSFTVNNLTTTNPMPLGVPGAWNFKPLLSDEFNGSSLDLAKWKPNWFGANDTSLTQNINYAGGDPTCFDPANLILGGGNLTFKAEARPCTIVDSYGKTVSLPYRSGIIHSRPDRYFLYGVAEARIYVPGTGADGTTTINWPAFWTGALDNNWPHSGEDDIMESLSGNLCFNYHRTGGQTGPRCTAHKAGWHTFASNWEPTRVTYYWDGVQVGYYDVSIPTPHALVLVYQMGLAHTYNQKVPSEMKVDYVRVWQR